MAKYQTCSLAMAFCVISTQTSAQAVTQLPRHAVTVSVGPTYGRGGELIERQAWAAAIAYERTFSSRSHFDLLGAGGLIANKHPQENVVCVMPSDQPCAPKEPDLIAMSATAGARVQAGFVQLTASAGPTVYYGEKKSPYHPSVEPADGSGIGFVWAGSLAFVLTRNVAITASYSDHSVNWADQWVHVAAGLIGVRVAW